MIHRIAHLEHRLVAPSRKDSRS